MVFPPSESINLSVRASNYESRLTTPLRLQCSTQILDVQSFLRRIGLIGTHLLRAGPVMTSMSISSM